MHHLEFWSKVISNYSQFTQSETKRLSAQVVQHGIPSALRGTIWPLLTNISNLQGLQEIYVQLLRQESVYEKAITRDLHRTFPHHPYFQSTQGQEALFNVVKAYSIYDPEVGYCQGLAFVAGPLLLNVNNCYLLFFVCLFMLFLIDARRGSILHACSVT